MVDAPRRVLCPSLACLFALGLSTVAAQAAPIGLVNMPAGAPLLPNAAMLGIANGFIFDLTGNDGVATEFGQVIPSFGNVPNTAPVSLIPGGGCFGFVTGELCGTNEPGAGFGGRFWEVELANTNGPALENFIAEFFAPGLFAAYNVTLPLNTGFYFDFLYLGPTVPLFGVFSGVPFPVTIATSILNPPPSFSLFPIEPFGPGGIASAVLCGIPGTAACPAGLPVLGTEGVVPEPGTLTLLGTGAGLLFARRRRRARTRQSHATPTRWRGSLR